MTDLAIRVEALSKTYRIRHLQQHRQYRTLREDLVALATGRLGRDGRSTRETFWALKDVSFEVKQGEAVGIIGRNGAGKSTLLKILSRISRPTTGQATVVGRVGSLLEVGTGFHPELTGHENIFLNGAILGMTRRDIQRRYAEIVAFAEIEQFLDTPVKRYSSGMYTRLAFAVAAHLEPEVLVLDEVLAVGDAAFQQKCLGKMGDVARGGRTVLFVSHQMNAVRQLCTRAICLSHGEITATGTPAAVISQYLRSGATRSEWVASPDGRNHNPYFSPTRFAIVDRNHEVVAGEIPNDQGFGVLIEGECTTHDEGLTVGFAVYAGGGELLFWSLHKDAAQDQWPAIVPGRNRLVAWLPPHLLNEGDYRIDMHVSLHYRAWLAEPGNNAPALDVSIRGGLSTSPYWMIARPGLLGPIIPFERLESADAGR